MKIYDYKLGRLGNAIFRYLASTLFCIIYDAERTYINRGNCIFSDNDFIIWSESVLNNNIPKINTNSNIVFYGFYQHDKIYYKYKDELIDWIIKHPDELLYTDGNNDVIHNYNYNETSYKSLDLIISPYNFKIYDFVVHLRLEDFVNNNDVIHPISIKNVLDQINQKNFCFVVNKITTELENKYINYFSKYYDITVESNDVIQDYHIMKNAKILVCSCSTLCWISAFFSTTLNTVYFPNYDNVRIHETFKRPISNTILYEFTKCTKNELENFLNYN